MRSAGSRPPVQLPPHPGLAQSRVRGIKLLMREARIGGEIRGALPRRTRASADLQAC